MALRTVSRLVGDTWVDCPFDSVRTGDRFRLYEGGALLGEYTAFLMPQGLAWSWVIATGAPIISRLYEGKSPLVSARRSASSAHSFLNISRATSRGTWGAACFDCPYHFDHVSAMEIRQPSPLTFKSSERGTHKSNYLVIELTTAPNW